MAIPSALLGSVKDLLRLPTTTATFDIRIEAAYQRALIELTRETDLFAAEQQISSVTDQSIYTTGDGTARILAVLYDRAQLMLVPSRSLDLLTTWQTDGSGVPEEWTADKIPPGLDGLTSISPLQFAIHPAPDVDGSGQAGLLVYAMAIPANDDPPIWCYPYLIYRTCAIYTGESTEERDPQAAQLWDGIAGIFRELMEM